MSACRYAMMQMFWRKHNLFKNSLCFQNQSFLSAWNKNIFESWFIIPKKSSSFFDLRLPKKLVITVRNLRMGHWLRIWWSDSKDLFSQFSWAKRWQVSKAFFLEKRILWKSSILKRFIFVVPEYGNLTGVKTHRDRLGNSWEGILELRVQIFGFGKGRGPHRGFGCCPVVALSFFCLLHPRVFENFLASALDRPFGFSP